MIHYKKSSEELDFLFFTVTTELPLTSRPIFNLATVGLLAVISGFSTLSIPVDTAPSAQVLSAEAAIAEAATTKEKVETYFRDLLIMVDIARCESEFKHTDRDGGIHRGRVNRLDVGVMQINEYYHLKKSAGLGYDIYSLEGNMAYARYLYEKEGARPWLHSSGCWARYSDIARK